MPAAGFVIEAVVTVVLSTAVSRPLAPLMP
jgi:hypothetical protein